MERYSPEIEKLIRLFWHRDKRTKGLKNLSAPQPVIEKSSYLVEAARMKLEALGFDQTKLMEAIGERFMDFEREELEERRMERCAHMLRHTQKMVQEDGMEMAPCKERGQDCFNCSDYEEVTDEQLENFYHGYDFETGEKLPEPPGLTRLKEEFGEDFE